MTRSLFLVALLLLVEVGAVADPVTEANFDGCRAKVEKQEAKLCYSRLVGVADTRLKNLYSEMNEKLKSDDEGRYLFQDEEKSWQRYRNAECERQAYLTKDDDVGSVVLSKCLITLTDRRNAELERQLDCANTPAACSMPEPK